MKVKTREIILEGFDRIQEIVMRLKLNERTLPPGDIKIKLNQSIYDGRCDYTWYGGLIAEVSSMDSEYRVMATGDVIVKLIDKDTNEEVASVKDRSNGGDFFDIMRHYIKNDTHLYEIIEDEDQEYKLVFSNNNWFEVFRDKICGSSDGDSYVSDCCNVFDVLAETVETIWYDYRGVIDEQEE